MKNFVVAFSVFMLWAVLGMWYYACVLKEVCDSEVLRENQTTDNRSPISDDVGEDSTLTGEERQVVELITRDSLSVVDSEFNAIFSYPLAPNVRVNSPVVEVPQTTNMFQRDITTYMEEHPDAHLIIFGAYDENEFESSAEDNFGLNRAANIRDLLIEEGLNAARISIESVPADLQFVHNEEFQGGILMQVKNYNELDEDEAQGTADGDRFNRIIHTNFDDTFRPDPETREYAQRLKEYLDKNPSKRITITGHTDDIGEAEDNQWIGMERAKSVRDFLRSQGIEDYKMQTFSKGETEPMVENTSRENRAQNRRIEIEIN